MFSDMSYEIHHVTDATVPVNIIMLVKVADNE